MNFKEILVAIAVIVIGMPAGGWLFYKGLGLPKLTAEQIERASEIEIGRKSFKPPNDQNGA